MSDFCPRLMEAFQRPFRGRLYPSSRRSNNRKFVQRERELSEMISDFIYSIQYSYIQYSIQYIYIQYSIQYSTVYNTSIYRSVHSTFIYSTVYSTFIYSTVYSTVQYTRHLYTDQYTVHLYTVLHAQADNFSLNGQKTKRGDCWNL